MKYERNMLVKNVLIEGCQTFEVWQPLKQTVMPMLSSLYVFDQRVTEYGTGIHNVELCMLSTVFATKTILLIIENMNFVINLNSQVNMSVA